MTVWQWLTNGWALAHLGVILIGLGVIKALDIRYMRRWKDKD